MTNSVFSYKLKPHTYYVLFIVILLSCFSWISLNYSTIYLPDSYEYLESENNIFIIPENSISDSLTKRTTFYPFILKLFSKYGTIVFQNILTGIILISLFKLLNLYRKGKSLTIFFFLSTLLSLNIFIYSNKIMAEVLCMALLWLAFWALVKKRGWLFGAAIMLLPFTKPVFLFLPVGILFLGLLHRYFRSRQIIFSCIFSLVLIGSYSAFNFIRTGSPEFSSIQHINALTYNRYQFDVARYDEAKALSYQDSIIALGNTLPYPEKVKLYNKGLTSAIQEAPLQYAWFHFTGAIRGVIDPGRFDLESFIPSLQTTGFLHRKRGNTWSFIKSLPWSVWLVLLPIALFNFFRVLLAVFGFIKAAKTPENLFAAFSILYLVLLSGPINASRFMVPLVPFVIYFSLFGVGPLLAKSQSHFSAQRRGTTTSISE